MRCMCKAVCASRIRVALPLLLLLLLLALALLPLKDVVKKDDFWSASPLLTFALTSDGIQRHRWCVMRVLEDAAPDERLSLASRASFRMFFSLSSPLRSPLSPSLLVVDENTLPQPDSLADARSQHHMPHPLRAQSLPLLDSAIASFTSPSLTMAHPLSSS